LAAVKAIDVTLAKRGKLKLIAGQPLHLVENPGIPAETRLASVPADPKRNGIHPAASQAGAVQRAVQAKPTQSFKHYVQPTPAVGPAQVAKPAQATTLVRAAPTNHATKSQPKAALPGMVMPIASSSAAGNHKQVAPSTGSKRASPFGPDHPNKKPKQGSLSRCVVCGQLPYHLVKDCPAVLEGPKRYVCSHI
jgi:chromodomain-helicase-DNA-binding protein 4